MKAETTIACVTLVLLGSVANPSSAQTITEIIDSARDGAGNGLDGPGGIAVDGLGGMIPPVDSKTRARLTRWMRSI